MMIMYFLIFLISNSVCKPLNFQIAGSDRPSSALDFFRPINVNEMQANWDQATFSSYKRDSESYNLRRIIKCRMLKCCNDCSATCYYLKI